MYGDAWVPHGRALMDYFHGDVSAALVVHSDRGECDELPVKVFFREPAEFWAWERAALDLCRGRVLDVGAGTGCHSLALQERGFSVRAIDFVPEAVEIMRHRGVREVRRDDLLDLLNQLPDGRLESFDTVLMLMNGAGIVETLSGLDRFLQSAHRLVAPGGQILMDSTDVRPKVAMAGESGPTDERSNGQIREDGRYIGEIQFELEYQGKKGAPFAQLYVDPVTLSRYAETAGWSSNVVVEGEGGGYLARLTRRATGVGES